MAAPVSMKLLLEFMNFDALFDERADQPGDGFVVALEGRN